MSGRICVVTGATSGIGEVTARELARKGATVIAVARDEARGQAAARAIQRETDNPAVTFLRADLSSLAQVRALAAEITARSPALHVLVNNAGGILGPRRPSADGLEATFATNHLGPFLLTHLLLDRLRAGAPARIVNVTSEAHRRGTLRFDDLQLERGYTPLRAYNASKLANIAFTFELARRLEGTGVTANCVHPGVVATPFGASSSAVFRLMFGLARPLLASAEEGARAQVHLASSPALEGVSGRYFFKMDEARPSAEASDPAVAGRLWEASRALAGLGG